jgi:hypothetical protein
MKVALMTYGYMRSFAQTISSLKEHLIIPYDTDVFISTYETFYGRKERDPHNSLENPGNLTVDQLQFPLYPHLKDLLLEWHDIDHYKREVDRMKLPEKNFMGAFTFRSLSMMDSIRKVIGLRKKYEQANHIKYDIVILARPDLIIAKFDIKNLDMNIVNGSISHQAPVLGSEYMFGDHMLISKSENIDIFSSLYDNIEKLYKQGITINNETLMCYHLLQNNIKFDKTDKFLHGVNRG